MTISEKIDLAGTMARYDEFAKYLLAEKIILAHILTQCIQEFQGYSPDEVVPLIEGNPEISGDPVTIMPSIRGSNTEDSVPGEGKITYDIRFDALLPDNTSSVKVLIDLEIQNDSNPGYPIPNRGVFYVSRMISKQKGTEFDGSDYQDMKKVFSIWLCFHVNASQANTLIRYHMVEDITALDGTLTRNEHHPADLMEIIMLGLSDEIIASVDDRNIFRMLETLFSTTLPSNEKKHILETDFHIPMTKEMMERSDYMSSLGQGILERGLKEGEARGIAIGESRGIAIGESRGIAIGEDKINRLNQLLLRDKRQEDLIRSVSDKAYQAQLVGEYEDELTQ